MTNSPLPAGVVADAADAGAAITIDAALTAGSGLFVAGTPGRSAAIARPRLQEPCETLLVAGRGSI
jgi:hypothetical protein